MIDNFLGLDIHQQIIIGVLFIGGIACWIWGSIVAICNHRKKDEE